MEDYKSPTPKMRTPHTSVYKGKRVEVVLRNGVTYIKRFIERTNKYIVLEDIGKIAKSNIKSFKIIKGTT